MLRRDEGNGTGDAVMAVICAAIGCGMGLRDSLRAEEQHGEQNHRGFYDAILRHGVIL